MVESPSRRPYIVALIIFAVCMAILTTVLYIPARLKMDDDRTYARAQSVSDSLNIYISNKQQIPASLAVAGIHKNDTANLSYNKNSDKSYTFCVHYRTTGYGDGLGPVSESSANLTITNPHKSGRNCQTIIPVFTVKDPPPVDVVAPPSGYNGITYGAAQGCSPNLYSSFYGKVTAITPASGASSVNGDPYTLAVEGGGETQNVLVPAVINVFDKNCTALFHNMVVVGDVVNIFFDNASQSDTIAGAVVDTSRTY